MPVSNVIVAPLVFTAHPSVTYRNVAELVAAREAVFQIREHP